MKRLLTLSLLLSISAWAPVSQAQELNTTHPQIAGSYQVARDEIWPPPIVSIVRTKEAKSWPNTLPLYSVEQPPKERQRLDNQLMIFSNAL